MRRGRRDYADGVWGPGLAAIAVTGAADLSSAAVKLGAANRHEAI